MTRLAAAIHPDPRHRREVVARMLAAFGEPDAIVEADGAALGTVGGTPGGTRRHEVGAIALDGLLYDLSAHADPDEALRRDDAAALARLMAHDGGVGALEQVNGDFGLAWYDERTRRLHLARDRFGMRPLFYARIDGGWVAASQPRGILQLTEIPTTPDDGFLVRFGAMHYRMIDNEPERSPYAAIAQVPAASIVTLTADRPTASTSRYWSMEDLGDLPGSEEELAEEYRVLLVEAVRARLARFPKRTFTLSGGMDSSSVLAAAVHLEGRPQVAFSSLYDDPTFDERDEIADMLEGHVADWRRIVLPSDVDLVADVDRMIDLHDEPVATATWLSHLRITEAAASEGFDAFFGGLGGDELNAGEYEYFPFHFADLRAAGSDDELRREIAAWVTHHDHPVFRKSPTVAEDAMRRLVDREQPGRCLVDTERLGRYLHVLSADRRPAGGFQPVMETVFDSYLKNRTWQDLSRETLPCCVRAEDRHGTYFGIPPVLPFLDPAVVEFMYRIPGTMKIRDGVTKRLLRRATTGLLPEATRERVKKTGWNAPAHLWFAGSGADVLRDVAHSSTFDRLGLYDRPAVLKLIDDHEHIVASGAARENHMMFLWPFLNLMRWISWIESGAPRRPIASR